MREALDPRLQAVYDSVRPGSRVADVGADHGLLICALVESGRCPAGIASEVRPGPLAAAERTIRERGLVDRIEIVLSDGLREIPGYRVDDVVIAGMGGELIGSLVRACPWLRDPAKRLVLQPMTRSAVLRRELYRLGFQLVRERAAVSGRFAYTVMTAAFTGQAREVDELFAQAGLLLGQRTDAAAAYLDRTARRLERQAAGLAKQRRTEQEYDRAAALQVLAAQIREGIQPCTE